MCRHNKCGNLKEKDCDKDILGCCHHIFNIAYDTEMAKTALVKAAFCQIATGLNDTDHPTLYMKWGKYLTFGCDVKKGKKTNSRPRGMGFDHGGQIH